MIERLNTFRDTLAGSASRSDPRICLLTPGPFSQTYFEQAHLARYLGLLLVEGDDLVVRDGHVYVRTIAGLKRADVMEGIAEMVDEVQVEATFPDGTKLVTLHQPIR